MLPSTELDLKVAGPSQADYRKSQAGFPKKFPETDTQTGHPFKQNFLIQFNSGKKKWRLKETKLAEFNSFWCNLGQEHVVTLSI